VNEFIACLPSRWRISGTVVLLWIQAFRLRQLAFKESDPTAPPSPHTDTGVQEKSSVESDKFPESLVSVCLEGSEGAQRRGDERVEP
jgi:hypothetical protein